MQARQAMERLVQLNAPSAPFSSRDSSHLHPALACGECGLYMVLVKGHQVFVKLKLTSNPEPYRSVHTKSSDDADSQMARA